MEALIGSFFLMVMLAVPSLSIPILAVMGTLHTPTAVTSGA